MLTSALQTKSSGRECWRFVSGIVRDQIDVRTAADLHLKVRRFVFGQLNGVVCRKISRSVLLFWLSCWPTESRFWELDVHPSLLGCRKDSSSSAMMSLPEIRSYWMSWLQVGHLSGKKCCRRSVFFNLVFHPAWFRKKLAHPAGTENRNISFSPAPGLRTYQVNLSVRKLRESFHSQKQYKLPRSGPLSLPTAEGQNAGSHESFSDRDSACFYLGMLTSTKPFVTAVEWHFLHH